MYILLIVLHLLACAVLMAAVLLQSGKGAEMGAAFGGSSQTLFGTRGAATLLSKMTVGAAVLFMLTSLSLSYLSRERSIASSVTDTRERKKEAAKESVPAAQQPAGPAAQQPPASPSPQQPAPPTQQPAAAPQTGVPARRALGAETGVETPSTAK